MTRAASGLLSELVLVRMHGRAASYLRAGDAERRLIAGICRAEATVADLAERIVSRTVYAQSSSRLGPLRELVQNALDASPRGARIDVRSSEDGFSLSVADRGRGMTRAELLEDLLVPFRSGKEDELETIGEHGIGFLSALEIAPRIRVTSVNGKGNLRLTVTPVGSGPPYTDFAWALAGAPPGDTLSTGTTVELSLARAIPRSALAAEIAVAASLVDPAAARIYVNDALINTARSRLRRVASVPIAGAGFRRERAGAGGASLELHVGRGDGIPPCLTVTQKGLFVTGRKDAFAGAELSLQRELFRAIAAAGYGLVAELPLAVPLNKGRSAVAAAAAPAVEAALLTAFERFVLEDALYDREMLRGVDHRLASVLDRLVNAALAGEAAADAGDGADALATTQRLPAPPPASVPPSSMPPGATPAPTVAAPEEIVHFAGALMDARVFSVASRGPGGDGVEQVSLRGVLAAYRTGQLHAAGGAMTPGHTYLVVTDPIGQALWRRLASGGAATASPEPRQRSVISMPRVGRERLLGEASFVPGVSALSAAVGVLERIDAAISAAAGLVPSPISVHQDLYGPDEMAHTDGSGISVNLASARLRTLLCAVLAADDATAFGALVDLLLHEKAHVSLATYVPRSTAEHGTSFYRRKDWLRRRLLQALAERRVLDPIGCLATARFGLGTVALPAPETLARAFPEAPLAA